VSEQLHESGYRKLEIYKLSHSLSIQIHKMTMGLPKFELYEEGSQIRRSSKSVPSNIVEGYVLRKYKNEFLHYLYRAQGSSEETVQHLKLLFETCSLNDEKLFNELFESYNRLNAMLYRFIKGVEQQHEKPLYLQEPEPFYYTSTDHSIIDPLTSNLESEL